MPFPTKDLPRPPGERFPLLHQVVPNQSKRALGQDRRADVEVSGVAGARGQSGRCEAVLGNVGVGGAENGFLDGRERGGGGGVVVGVVGALLLLLLLELVASL